MRALAAFLLLLLPVFAFAQKAENPDSLFSMAKQEAYQGHYKDALVICEKLCADYPSNTDYRIFTARVLAWSSDYEKARIYLEPLKNPASEETLDLLSDIELWSDNYEAAIAYCDQALALPAVNTTGFLMKKAKALEQSGKIDEAISTLNELLAKQADNENAKEMLERLMDKKRRNAISISYLNSSFSNPCFAPWHFGYAEYMRKIPGCPLIGRLNFGNVDSIRSFQVEADAYPKLGKKMYAYLNAGYSPAAELFPAFKAGIELYRKIYKPFEVSAGMRYMKFTGENVFIYTAYAGYYHKSWWFSARNYIVASEGKTFATWVASARKYSGDENRYVSLDLAYGAAPYIFSSLQDIARTNAARAGVQGQFRIGHTFFVHPMVMYEYEEYYPGSFRNRWDAQVTLLKKF